MERNLIWLALFALFVIEGAMLPPLIPDWFGFTAHVNAQLVLVGVMLIGLLYNRHSALLYGICFGFMHDLIYGQMLGVSAFALGLTGYLLGLLFASKYETVARNLFVMLLGLLFYEAVIVLFYFAFNLYTPVFSFSFFLHEWLPAWILNFLFALVIYYPARHVLQKFATRTGRNVR
jgi:rod shape-determining protein MreD